MRSEIIFALVLGHRRQNVHSELVGVSIIDRDELDTALHQSGDKGQVSGQTVELGNDKLRPVLLASFATEVTPRIPLRDCRAGLLISDRLRLLRPETV